MEQSCFFSPYKPIVSVGIFMPHSLLNLVRWLTLASFLFVDSQRYKFHSPWKSGFSGLKDNSLYPPKRMSDLKSHGCVCGFMSSLHILLNFGFIGSYCLLLVNNSEVCGTGFVTPRLYALECCFCFYAHYLTLLLAAIFYVVGAV